MKVYLTFLGCKLNQSEIEALAREFIVAGHQVVGPDDEANLCVVNTCTVTHIAARKSRQLIRRLHRANPQARIVVTGCYAEMSPEEIRGIEGVNLVVGNEDKERLVGMVGGTKRNLSPENMKECMTGGNAILRQQTGRGFVRSKGQRARVSLSPIPYPLFPNRTRAFVKIQDGCDNACTYCVVTIARGRQRSRPPEEVLAEIQARFAAGYKEVVLTGVHIGAYGRDIGTSLSDLVEQILRGTDVPRLRLSSIEPWDLDSALLSLWHDRRLCRHLHLPLQSGCDATLRRMGRRCSAAQYAEKVRMAREAIPDPAVTTDIIVGFPGETEAEFEESYRFVEAMGFARAHVFKYSPRPGTVAAAMPHQVPPAVKHARSEAMIALAKQNSERFRRRFIGQTMDVLWEKNKGQGTRGKGQGLSIWSGLTDNYIRVMAESESDLTNNITPTKLIGLAPGGMRGEV